MKSRRYLPLAAILLFSTAAFAQQNNPSSLFAKDSTEGVYVRDSAVAAEKLALALRLEHLEEWSKAADIYQELLREYADRVTPSDERDQQIYQYTSVALSVQSHLAHWPKEALDVYRTRFDTESASLLQQAGTDPALLHKLISLFFITDAAKVAAIRLIDANLESGDFAAAAWMGDRLLTLHPNLADDRPMLLYRTALAYRLAGNNSLSQKRADELKKDFAAATGTVRGKQVVLSDSLEEQLQLAHPQAEQSSRDSWPMPFGSLDRARVPNVAGFGGAKIFTVDLTKENLRSIANAQQRQHIQADNRLDRDKGMMSGVMPVIDRGELFFQDNARVYAVSLDSGLPLAGWASTYDGDREGRYSITAWSTPRNLQYTVTLTDDSVLALMGQIDMTSLLAGLNINQRDSRLVCLDRRTGKERWVVRPSQLATEALQQLELTGTPLVVNDSVFITAHSTAGVQFQDCYLLCFDLAGRFRFASYIASANSGPAVFNEEFAGLSQEAPQLAYSSGRVFVMSNLGALAAVDAYDGTIVWLNLYTRESQNDAARQFGFRGWARFASQPDNNRPWTASPVIISDGKVFTVPTDGQFMMVYDAGTGAEIKRVKLANLGNVSTLVGVLDDRAILCGSTEGTDDQTKVVCVNWKNYDLANFSPTSGGMLLWRESPPSPIRGRAFLSADAVYVPTAKKLFKFNLRTGSIDAQYPEGERDWDAKESPGNILVTQDHLIVAGPEEVNVYTDLNLATAKLDKEVAAAPDDPGTRLRYAEVMFVAGKYDLAVAKLDEAIQVIGGLQKTTDSTARDRIYTSAMAFAENPLRGKDMAFAAMVGGLYDRAAAAASTAQQQVNYRISRARFAHENQDDAAELKLLQEILSEPSWRNVAVVQGDSPAPAQASSVAEKSIDDLIQRSPQIYAPIAAQAQQAFLAAQTSADPAKLLAVAQTYPNAKTISPQALLKAADAYEQVGNPRQAVQILRQLYFKYPQASNRAEVIESLVRNYLATPNHVDVALARLAQGAKLPNKPNLTKPLVLPDGSVIKDVSFEQALTQLRQYHDQAVTKALPDFGLPRAADWPTAKAFVRPTAPVASHVLSIVAPLKEMSRTDRLVTFNQDSGITVYSTGTSTPIFSSKVIADIPRNCAWMGQNLLIWSTSKIALLKPDGSGSMWETELKTVPIVEVAMRDNDDTSGGDTDADAPAQPPVNLGQRVIIMRNGGRVIIAGNGQLRIRGQVFMPPGGVGIGVQPAVAAGAEQILNVVVVSDRAVLSTTGGRIISLDLSDGKTTWQTRPSDRAPDRLMATDDFVVAAINEGPQTRVVALDTYSGQVISHREFAVDLIQLVNLALAPDGHLVYLLADRLECKDLFEPGERLTFSMQARKPDGTGAFVGSNQPDQLLISQGRVIVVSDDNRFVRAYSMETGKPLHGNGGTVEGVDNSAGLQTKWIDGQVGLCVAGPRVYAVGAKSLVAYNLDQLADTWNSPPFGDDVARDGDTMIGKDYVIVVAETSNNLRPRAIGQFTGSLVFRAYSRAISDGGHESGLFPYRYVLGNPAGIQSFQGVDGGIYYLAGDQKLYFLKGGKK